MIPKASYRQTICFPLAFTDKSEGYGIMKNLPIGRQSFKDIRERNEVYVDKTRYLYALVKNGGVFFLSRPRRFGKSLLISTLNEIFLGNKEAFSGLWMENSDYDWKKYPIIRIDFSKQKAKNTEQLERFIKEQLDYIAEDYGIRLTHQEYFSRFDQLIQLLSKESKIVILIDEYDKPIIDHLENPELAKEMREILKGFYTVIKAGDENLRFVLLTGVSKFSKAGVFSGLNNLNDISMDNKYASILGLTENEITDNFSGYLEIFAAEKNISVEDLIQKIRAWYNGYLFAGIGERVYNPFSTLLLFDKNEFRNYWFETGTPSFLVNILKQTDFPLSSLESAEAEAEKFSVYDIENLDPIPLLYQTGYLTIKEYSEEFGSYILGYPNFEVKNSFTKALASAFSKNHSDMPINSLIRSLRDRDWETFFHGLREIFLKIDYDLQINQEKYYQTIFYLIFTLIGLKTSAEVKTNIGRIDTVIDDRDILIFEFKFSSTGAGAQDALNQIKSKKYFEKYQSSSKEIFLFGAEFRDRNIGEWIFEKV